MMYSLESINLELTTKCPLRCPQCYCSLEGGKDLDTSFAIRMLKEAAECGAEHVELSGGETMCYPDLIKVIQEACKVNLKPNIAISGYNINRDSAMRLIDAGVDGIFISINAPTPELNALSRDGFDLALHALQVMAELNYDKIYINWVMHRQTADTLEDMIKLVSPFHPEGIIIMVPKPDSLHTLRSMPTKTQMENAVKLIKKQENDIGVFVENCFSQMLALVGENKLWGNLNRGIHKGCGAGLTSLSISVDRLFSPCRHLEYFEDYDSLEQYWKESAVLQTIRQLDYTKAEPCSSCYYSRYCRHCLAINAKLHNKLQFGNEFCALGGKDD